MQTIPSSVQAVPLGFLPSVGQVVEVPVQVSATSHSPLTGRQTVPGLPAGCWQAVLVPSHWSLVQTLPSSVQAVPLVFLASAGQLAEDPVQFSARSHSPAAARQPVVAGAKPSVGQVTDVPLQVSATSQTLTEARHTVPLVIGEQMPTLPVRLQAPQPPLQAVSQQTPPTQKPEAHWLADVHERPEEPS